MVSLVVGDHNSCTGMMQRSHVDLVDALLALVVAMNTSSEEKLENHVARRLRVAMQAADLRSDTDSVDVVVLERWSTLWVQDADIRKPLPQGLMSLGTETTSAALSQLLACTEDMRMHVERAILLFARTLLASADCSRVTKEVQAKAEELQHCLPEQVKTIMRTAKIYHNINDHVERMKNGKAAGIVEVANDLTDAQSADGVVKSWSTYQQWVSELTDEWCKMFTNLKGRLDIDFFGSYVEKWAKLEEAVSSWDFAEFQYLGADGEADEVRTTDAKKVEQSAFALVSSLKTIEVLYTNVGNMLWCPQEIRDSIRDAFKKRDATKSLVKKATVIVAMQMYVHALLLPDLDAKGRQRQVNAVTQFVQKRLTVQDADLPENLTSKLVSQRKDRAAQPTENMPAAVAATEKVSVTQPQRKFRRTKM